MKLVFDISVRKGIFRSGGIITFFIGKTTFEVIRMAKKGMKRIDRTHTRSKNDAAPVPEIQGKAKHGEEQARPIISGTYPPEQKVFHTTPFTNKRGGDKPISDVYPVIDNDLARDNLENDITAADLQDL